MEKAFGLDKYKDLGGTRWFEREAEPGWPRSLTGSPVREPLNGEMSSSMVETVVQRRRRHATSRPSLGRWPLSTAAAPTTALISPNVSRFAVRKPARLSILNRSPTGRTLTRRLSQGVAADPSRRVCFLRNLAMYRISRDGQEPIVDVDTVKAIEPIALEQAGALPRRRDQRRPAA